MAGTALAEPTLDTTKPTITGSSVPAANGAGWNNGPVAVTFTCTDEPGGSGIATDTVADPATVSGINIDTIYPTVTFTGVGLYSLLQTVTVTCVPGDALSGIASSTCSAPPPSLAWTLGLGPHPVTSAVTDNAGNALFAATVFSVGVTYDDLCGLTRKFSSSWRTAWELCEVLEDAERAEYRDRYWDKKRYLDEYVSTVRYKSGDRYWYWKAFTSDEGATLIAFADALR